MPNEGPHILTVPRFLELQRKASKLNSLHSSTPMSQMSLSTNFPRLLKYVLARLRSSEPLVFLNAKPRTSLAQLRANTASQTQMRVALYLRKQASKWHKNEFPEKKPS